MKHKTFMTLDTLKEWRAIANRNDTQEEYIDLVLEWAQACHNSYLDNLKTIEELNAKVSKLENQLQFHMYD